MSDAEWDMVKNRLDAAGLPSEDFGIFGRLRKTSFDSRRSVPLLLELLPQVKNPRVKESIVRHLSTKYARPMAAHPLIEEFRVTPNSQGALKWAIGNALDVVIGNDDLDQLLQLVSDGSHGVGRQMLVSRLGRGPRRPEIAQALIDLLGDEDVTLHAISALRQQIGNERTRTRVEALLQHSNTKVQDQARRELEKIDKALNRKR